MDGVVTLTHRNVCKDGFTVIDKVDSGQCISNSVTKIPCITADGPFSIS